MKRYTPYLLALLLATAIVLLFITGDNYKNRRLDERITLRKQDKIPYATYVAYNNLESLFPKATIRTSRLEPGYWDSVSMYDSGQAYLTITDRFSADDDEMRKLIAFARAGNDVFISARYISSAADEAFGCGSSAYDLSFFSSVIWMKGQGFHSTIPRSVTLYVTGIPERHLVLIFQQLTHRLQKY
ncbi:MAG: hypothetical protein IPK57_01410 [Chitinophagaceae bacterium]|nr:hypothetical protein [Chitinophagaceae bacterium]